MMLWDGKMGKSVVIGRFLFHGVGVDMAVDGGADSEGKHIGVAQIGPDQIEDLLLMKK
jgi:hypothetical protein